MERGTQGLYTLFLYQSLYNGLYGLCNLMILRMLAPRHGFEPRFTAPKAAVLPLDDRGMISRGRTTSVYQGVITAQGDSGNAPILSSVQRSSVLVDSLAPLRTIPGRSLAS